MYMYIYIYIRTQYLQMPRDDARHAAKRRRRYVFLLYIYVCLLYRYVCLLYSRQYPIPRSFLSVSPYIYLSYTGYILQIYTYIYFLFHLNFKRDKVHICVKFTSNFTFVWISHAISQLCAFLIARSSFAYVGHRWPIQEPCMGHRWPIQVKRLF